MICLIFTRKKLLVGVQGKITEFLRFSGKPYIDYNGQHMYDIFDKCFPKIIEVFLLYTQKNQLVVQDSIPVVLSFPAETFQTSAGQQMINDIQIRLTELISPTFSIVATHALHIDYLQGIHLQDDVLEEGCAVVEAIDGYPSLIYVYHPEDGLKGGHSVPIPRIGISGNSQSLLQALEAEFGKMGLSLNQEDRDSLLSQIQQKPIVDTFVLDKSYGASKMKLEVARNSLLADDPMLIYKQVFDEWLSEAKLEALGVKKLFLAGESLKQGVVRGLINERLNQETRIEVIEHVRTQAIWKFIVKGALSYIPKEQVVSTSNGNHYKPVYPNGQNYITPPPSYKEQEETENVDQNASYADQVLKSIEQEPIQEIQESVILTPQRQQSDVESSNRSMLEQEDHSWMSRLGFQEDPYRINKASEDLSFFDLYHVIKKWDGAPFNNYEVQDKINQGKFILKYISKEDLASHELKSSFYYVFEKEKAYYDLESSLTLTKEGLYYLRPFFKGITLLNAIKESKIYDKKSLADYNSKDLKLVVTVLETINTLQVSHAAINEHNILIFKGRNWSLRREYYATLIGFSPEDWPKEDMMEQTHNIFERLLHTGVYQQLRQTLEL